MTKEEILEIVSKIGGTAGRADYAGRIYDVTNRLPSDCRILEIGTQLGGSAIDMALTVRDRGGKVHCIDPCFIKENERTREQSVCDGIGGYTLGIIEETMDMLRIDRDIITMHPGTSKEVYDRNEIDTKFDLVFIDGAHTYEGVKQDMLWLDTHTKDNAMVMLDDWMKEVIRACTEYMRSHTEWRMHTYDEIPVLFSKGNF